MHVQEHVPSAVYAERMTIPHVLLEMVLPLEYLVLLAARADTACVNTVRMLYAMSQESVASRICLTTPGLLTSPTLVQRAPGMPVEALEVVELEPTF